ncbi:NAD(P)/FAD-dependent oxidoreductase [soil metagenome]
MTASPQFDAVVVGSGPNGLMAAVTVARAGRSVAVFEAAPTPGGGTRTAELTRPGFRHDVCSAIHPFGVASPAFAELDLARHGLRWIHPDAPMAHPLDDHTVVMSRSVDATAAGLGDDGDAWRRLIGRQAAAIERYLPDITSGLRLPRHPVATARFGLVGGRSASGLADARFTTADARALFAGIAAHAVLPFDRRLSASVGVLLGALGHAVGWPMAAGGSQAIADALVAELAEHGGVVHCGMPVASLAELPSSRVVLADVSPRGLDRLAGGRLPVRYRRRLLAFRHGPAAFKIDHALSAPVPWRDPATARAATVHIGGTIEEIAAAEAAPWASRHAERPFVLTVQSSLFDPDRAPTGGHTLWSYCHVPNGSDVDMTDAIESQIERFAPGFRDTIVARHVTPPAALEAGNANYVGGDISGGALDWRQLVTRPVPSLRPWATPCPGLYICSASTPPGGGVHGLSGWHAARLALRRELRD